MMVRNQLSNLMPMIQVSKGPSQPRTAPVYKAKWVRRYYLSSGTRCTTAGDLNIPWSSITNLPTGNYIVDKITIFQVAFSGPGNPGMRVALDSSVYLENSLSTEKPEGQDYGTYSHMPAVTFKMPAGHTKILALPGNVVIATVRAAEVSDVFAAAVHVWVQI